MVFSRKGTKKYNKNLKHYIYAVFPKRFHALLRMNVKLPGDIIQFETYLRFRPWIISRFVNPRPSFWIYFPWSWVSFLLTFYRGKADFIDGFFKQDFACYKILLPDADLTKLFYVL
jgi:hypothetical protein